MKIWKILVIIGMIMGLYYLYRMIRAGRSLDVLVLIIVLIIGFGTISYYNYIKENYIS